MYAGMAAPGTHGRSVGRIAAPSTLTWACGPPGKLKEFLTAAAAPPALPAPEPPGLPAGPRRLRLLRALAQNPEPLSTPRLVTLLAEPDPRPGLLSRYGESLRGEEEAGRVEGAGCRPGGPGLRGRGPVTWSITSAGLAWLAEHDKAQALAATAAGELQRSAAERDRALAEARASFSRETPRPERKQAADRLRGLGCTLQQIADVFAVTREMIRQDLARDPELPPRRPGRPAKSPPPPEPPPQPKPETLRTPWTWRLSVAQTRVLLAMYQDQPDGDCYRRDASTLQALLERGLVARTGRSGCGTANGHSLTEEGRRAASQLADAPASGSAVRRPA